MGRAPHQKAQPVHLMHGQFPITVDDNGDYVATVSGKRVSAPTLYAVKAKIDREAAHERC
jgi:hypothetical protein